MAYDINMKMNLILKYTHIQTRMEILMIEKEKVKEHSF